LQQRINFADHYFPLCMQRHGQPLKQEGGYVVSLLLLFVWAWFLQSCDHSFSLKITVWIIQRRL